MDSSRPSQFDHREDNPGSTTAKSFSVESMARDGAQAGASAGRTGLEREGAQEHTDFWDGSLGEQQREGVPGETRAGNAHGQLWCESQVAPDESCRHPQADATGISSDSPAVAFPTSTSPLPSPQSEQQAQSPQQHPYHQLPPFFFVPVTYGPPPPPFLSPPPPGFASLPPAFFGPPPFHPPPMHHLPPHPHDFAPPPLPHQPQPDPLPPRIHHSPSVPELHHPPYRQHSFTEQHHRQGSFPTAEELFGPPPCAVCYCFRPTFCQLAPCGCRICREHVGTVIRGAKIVEEEGAEGEAKKKAFECVACRAKSHTMGPARSDATSLVELDVEDGVGQGAGKTRRRTSSDGSLFSVSFNAPAVRTPTRLEGGSISGPSSSSTPHPSLPRKISFPTVLALPPPPSYEPPTPSRRTRAVSTPSTSASTDQPSFPPNSPVLSRPRKQKSFSGIVPTTTRVGPLKRLSHSDLGALKEKESQRGKDWRSPLEDPSEPYQIKEGEWPIVKVENIPFNTTTKDVEAWLPPNCLPSPENVISSIHIILHRPTGRTLPHCYLEMSSKEEAQKVVDRLDRSQLGDRTVRVKRERPGELMRDEDYFTVPHISPASAPLPGFFGNYKLPSKIIDESDVERLLTFCSSRRSRPFERPFLAIVSVIAKFPWASEELWNDEQRDSLFECILAGMGIAAQCGDEEPLLRPIIHKTRITGLSCPGFTEFQKEKIKACKTEDHALPFAKPPSPLDELFPPLVPPPSAHASQEKARSSTTGFRKPVPPPSPPVHRSDKGIEHSVWNKGVRTSASIESFVLDHPVPETPPQTPAAKEVELPSPMIRDPPRRAGKGRMRGGWGFEGDLAEAEWVEGEVGSSGASP